MVLDLQEAIRVERQKALEWMERHNRERDSRQLAQAELEECGRRLAQANALAEREREETVQLQGMYEAERAQSTMLEEALRCVRGAGERPQL